MSINFGRSESTCRIRARLGILTAVAGALLILLWATLPGQAQQITGSITGTVKDSSGAVVSGATIKATNDATGFSRSVTANAYGDYRVDYLPVGAYTVEVKAQGFKTSLQPAITLTLDQVQRVDVELTVGSQTQVVTVTAAPPTVNTTSAELGRTHSAGRNRRPAPRQP